MTALSKLHRRQKIGGNVLYLGGHEYPDNEPGAIVYLNMVLLPAARPGGCGFEITTTTYEQDSKRGSVPLTDIECGCDVTYDYCGVCGGPDTTSCPSGEQGSCCLPNDVISGDFAVREYSCAFPYSQSGCLAEGGVYEGIEKNCFTETGVCNIQTVIGACCPAAAGDCTHTTSTECSGAWHANRSCAAECPNSDEDMGACCAGPGDCQQQTRASCGEEFFGFQSCSAACPAPVIPKGSCCNTVAGQCTQQTEAECSYDWVKDGDCSVECASTTGACCLNFGEDNSCAVTSSAECSTYYIPGQISCNGFCEPEPVSSSVDSGSGSSSSSSSGSVADGGDGGSGDGSSNTQGGDGQSVASGLQNWNDLL
eukprot:TRINITY_DN3061_c0_g1_i1.p1 TRINITY_DN3061_c0_g1~~TRINITY_DN3061_c0_g1_i1.p1  ORF type:complete len:388 (-),score=47.66 TRINITY_DN3061_c0_g1_i1:25-1125(-)